MRHPFLIALLITASACSMNQTPQAVDASALPPMNGKEIALMAAADGALRTGNTAGAERDYLEAVAQSQGQVAAHLALAKLYLTQNQPEKARPILERAQTLQPRNSYVNYLLGKVGILENQPQAALDAFTRALEVKPQDVDMLSGAGVAQDMLRHHTQAQALYLRAIAQNPKADLTMVRTNLAMSYLLSNQPQKAVPLLKTEMKKPGASGVTRHNLALAYGLLGKNSEAKALVSKEMTEQDRQLAVARLQAYIAQPAETVPPLLTNR